MEKTDALSLPKKEGIIVSVQGPVVDIRFPDENQMPNLYEAVHTQTVDGKKLALQVVEHTKKNTARCVAFGSTLNLQYQAKAVASGAPVRISVGPETFGRIMNAVGEPIDGRGAFLNEETSVIKKRTQPHFKTKDTVAQPVQILETGIKMIDLFFPFAKGGKTGVLGGAALGKSLLILELMHNIIKKHRGVCVFTGIGERIREGNELYLEFVKQNILDRVIMAFGQMNEPPGMRMEVASTGMTLAEHLQDQNQDVLFFVDNVYRFVQAGAEVSTLLGRVPSETGYQPTLTSELADFHERIRSKGHGSITAMEAVYVPADDLTDPAVVTIFSYLDTIMVLSREKIQLGLYPAIDPLTSSCNYLDPHILGQRHFDIVQQCLRTLTKYEELRKIVMVIGFEELSKADRVLFERAQKILNFMTQPFFVAEIYTGKAGQYVPLEHTLEICEKILAGRFDPVPAQDFYMVGHFGEKH